MTPYNKLLHTEKFYGIPGTQYLIPTKTFCGQAADVLVRKQKKEAKHEKN